MKVADLSGDLLDYWVARSNGYKAYMAKAGCFLGKEYRPICIYGPSTEWSQGGPIIESEEIGVGPDYYEGWKAWKESKDSHPKVYTGKTALVAAMRRFVAMKFGPEVPDDK